MKPNFILSFVALAALLCAQSEASAGPVSNPSFAPPDATGSIQLIACSFGGPCQQNQIQNQQVDFPPDQAMQTVTAGGPNSPSASGTINYQPALSSSSISATLNAYPESTDFVLFTYFFGVYDPLAKAGFYSVTLTTRGNISGGPSSFENVQVFAQGEFNSPLFSDYACTAGCGDGLPLQGSFSDTKDLKDLSVNTTYVLQMMIALSFSDSSAGFTKATASIDPTLTVDQSGLQLEVSPNLTPTLLPSTWLLMLSGLAALGFVAHRRQTHGSAMAGC